MENILQSLVKIIIIGILQKIPFVNCNGQFLPPPLPYYPNGNFFIPGFAPPYQEQFPVYYREDNPPPPPPPPPISFQNSYSPPQLFHRNENYNPLQLVNPSVGYSPPQIIPYKPVFNQANLNNGISQFNFKKPSQVPVESQERPSEGAKKKPAFYATNIIIKEESPTSYYSDDYNKNYHDEDYTDNYSDESPPQPEPCLLNSPYRYFESPKTNPNNPNVEDKYTLCSSYFQPNFGNGVYTVKMPITLLPSRFPPRVEQLIERIQNYFSTYTQQETLKPENETLTTTTTTLQPTTLDNDVQVNATTEHLDKKNSTEQNLEQTNTNPPEEVTFVAGNEQVTQKTIVVTIPEEETFSTTAPDIQNPEESQVVNETNETPIALVETATTVITPRGESPMSEEQPKVDVRAQEPSVVNSTENQHFQEASIAPVTDVNVLNNTTEVAVINNSTEEVFTLKEGLLEINVTDSNG